jgi:hypothetical protein
MLELGPFTLKMLLFSLTLIYTTWSLLSLDRIQYSTMLLTSSFAALLCIGIMNGVGHASNMKFLGEDVSPLLSFLTLPFFELTIRRKHEIFLVMRIIVFAAIVMAAGYMTIIISLLLQIVSVGTLYGWITLNGGEDFVFEGETGRFFYKGVIFICIAIIFLAFQNRRRCKVIAGILLLTLFFVGSRGLFLALALSALLYVLIGQMSVVRKISISCIVILVAATALPQLFSFAGDKTESNATRLNTISQVSSRINAASFLVGHGFGNGVPEKPEHMEITYLEILHKQGMIGLAWWTALIAGLAIRLRKAIKLGEQYLAYPLFLSAAFILFESATNPFVNNPIGMYPFIISFVGLGLLARRGKLNSSSTLGEHPADE